jgi:MOB kinase activator 1
LRMPLFGFSSNKTFKPKKGQATGRREELHKYAQATLGSGDMRAAVALPPATDENEWLAVHTVDFYNEASVSDEDCFKLLFLVACASTLLGDDVGSLQLLFGTVVDFCTPESCPTMNAGPKYEYLWGEAGSKPVRVPAREYVDLLMVG